MGLEIIDYLATQEKSPIHSSNTIYKMVFALVNIVLLLTTKSIHFPYIILFFLFSIMVLNKIPLLKIIPLLFYPIFFSGLLVLGLGYGYIGGLWLITKAVGIATTMILVFATTPIYNLFSLLQRFLPDFLVDGLFFTYRSFFIFQRLVTNLILTIKLKGGYGRLSLLKNIRNIGGAIAITFIRALDGAERMKDIFYIRGYQIGNIKIQKEENTIWNAYPIFLSLFVMVIYFWV